jgi:hypothetical protein
VEQVSDEENVRKKLGPKITVYVVDHTSEYVYPVATVFMSIVSFLMIQKKDYPFTIGLF